MNYVMVDNTVKTVIGGTHFRTNINNIKNVEFFVKMEKKYPGKIDFTDTVYKNIQTPITVRCIKHDKVFTQAPRGMYDGAEGCKECRKKNLYLELIRCGIMNTPMIM